NHLSLFNFNLLPYFFGFAQDTPARQNASKLAFALGLFDFGFAQDTPARQNASKLAFALA
ncbi:MAG: hypothetical protein K2L06_02860, partial [Alistipes sp.]|nr:hypothetical protein [Alistipes sp.]